MIPESYDVIEIRRALLVDCVQVAASQAAEHVLAGLTEHTRTRLAGLGEIEVIDFANGNLEIAGVPLFPDNGFVCLARDLFRKCVNSEVYAIPARTLVEPYRRSLVLLAKMGGIHG